MKKYYLYVVIFVLLLFPISVEAQRGCCSHHGGITNACSSSGHTICQDGTTSPTCTCTPTYSKPTYIKGCTHNTAINYSASANLDDGSCQYEKIETKEEVIPYQTEYQNEKNETYQKETIIQNGEDGIKTITIKTITNQAGTILSQETIKEEITKAVTPKKVEYKKVVEKEKESKENKQVKKSEDENDNSGIAIIFYILITPMCLVNYWYFKKNQNKFSLIQEIEKEKYKWFIYIFYYLFILPVLVDFTLLIIYQIKEFYIQKSSLK